MSACCDDCGRRVVREPIVHEGKTYGRRCAAKRGIRPERQVPVKWQKLSGASLSAFRRPPGANARHMRGAREAQPPAPKWRANPTALPGEVMLPLWDDNTEGGTRAEDTDPVHS